MDHAAVKCQDIAFGKLIQSMPAMSLDKLQRIKLTELEHSEDITLSIMQHLTQVATNITDLDVTYTLYRPKPVPTCLSIEKLRSASNLTAETVLQYYIEHSINTMTLTHVLVEDQHFRDLSLLLHFPNLTAVTFAGFASLQKLTQLTALEFRTAYNYTFISQLYTEQPFGSHLLHLTIHVDPNHSDIRHILQMVGKHCHDLTTLSVEHNDPKTLSSWQEDSVFANMQCAKTLQQLYLRNTTLSNADVHEVCQFAQLTSLMLLCANVTTQHMIQLGSNLTQLQHFAVGSAKYQAEHPFTLQQFVQALLPCVRNVNCLHVNLTELPDTKTLLHLLSPYAKLYTLIVSTTIHDKSGAQTVKQKTYERNKQNQFARTLVAQASHLTPFKMP